MPETLTDQIQTRVKHAFDVKFYIKDTNDKWVDFSDQPENLGKNAYKKIGKIENRIERQTGQLVTTIQNVLFDNSDGFFDRPFPSTLKTVDGATAVFDLTSGYQRSILRGRECKVTVRMRVPITLQHKTTGSAGASPIGAVEEQVLGHFFVEDITPDFKRKTIKLKLISFDHRLQEKDASGVKDGYGWYVMRSASFLIETIVRSEFQDILNTYNIQKNPFFATLDGSDVPSVLGRPPLWDGTDWRRDGFHCRAICICNVNSTGNRLYLGCDNELWYYDWTTGVYTSVDTTTIPAGQEIKALFYDSQDDILIVYTWEDEYWGLDQAETLLLGWPMRCYRWAGSGSLTVVSTTLAINSFKHHIRITENLLYSGSMQMLVGINDYGIGNTNSGENFYVPYAQDIMIADAEAAGAETYRIYNAEDAAGYSSVISTLITPTEVNDTYFAYVNRGWSRMWNSVVSPTDYSTPMMYHIGQPYCILMGDVASGKRVILWFRHKYISASPDYNIFSMPGTGMWGQLWVTLYAHNPINNGNAMVALPSGCEDMLPLCMFQNGPINKAYVILIKHNRVNTAFTLHRLKITDDVMPPTISAVRQIAPDAWICPIAVEAFGNNIGGGEDAMVIIWFHRGSTKTNGTGQYIITWCVVNHLEYTSDLFNDVGVQKMKTSPAPFTGLCRDGDDAIKFFATGEGRVYTISKSGFMFPDNQRPVVPEETGLLSNMVTDDDGGTFGISSPILQLETLSAYQSGKYFLWRYSPYVTDLIELADFDGMTKWGAIRQLSQSRDGLSFFDREGNFHFVDRIYTAGTADYTFGELGTDVIQYTDIVLDYGYQKVYNVAKTKIYTSKYDPPNLDALTLVRRPKRNKSNRDENIIPFVGYSLEQRDTEKKKVYAYCIRGGSTTDGLSRWKYMTIDIEVEAILDADAASSATTFSLQSVFGGDDYEEGIHSLDYATIVNPSTGAAIIRLISSVNESTDQITTGASFGVALKRGAIIKISRGFRADDLASPSKTIWSDEGVTYVTASAAVNATQVIVNSVTNLSIDSVIRFEDEFQWQNAFTTEYRITDIGEYNGSTGYPITIKLLNGTTTNVLQDALTAGDHVFAFYSPEDADGGEIGGTNVFVKWSAGSGTEGVNYIKTFHVSDRLIIDCPGASLQEEAASMSVVVDSVSDTEHGRSELNIDNRFMSSIVGTEASKRIIHKYARPRYHVKLTVPLVPHIDIITRSSGNTFKLTQINIVNSALFPLSEGNEESFLMDAISHDPNKGLTTFELSGITAY